MDISEIKSKILDILAEEADRYFGGEKNVYFYKCEHTEEYGDTDVNYFRRLRLVFALRFGVRRIGEPQLEQAVRELFEQETVSREKVSFQGIGRNIELLTLLMEPYRKPGDEEMFQRVKDANFDCYCGYDMSGEEYEDMYPDSLEDYSLEDLIYLTEDMNMNELLYALVDIFKAQGVEGERIFKLKTFARYTGRAEDMELAVRGSYEQAFRAENTGIQAKMQQLTAANDMIHLLVKEGRTNEAFELLKKHTEALRHGNHRAFYGCAYEIMKADRKLLLPVWAYVRMLIDKLYPVCIGDIKKCAELAGDKKTVKHMEMLEKHNK